MRGWEEGRSAWRRVREIGVPRVRMGSKGEKECSPVDEEKKEGLRDVGPEEPR